MSTLRRMRSRFESEGVAGLVDGRRRKPATGTSRADPRVVEAIAEVAGSRTDRPTVSAQGVRRRVEHLLVAGHGTGAVRMPSRAAFYRLLEAVSTRQQRGAYGRSRWSCRRQCWSSLPTGGKLGALGHARGIQDKPFARH